MINTIKYYYNLNISDIKQIDNDYYFDNYIFKVYYRELDIELYNYLINNNYYLHQIIYNRNNEYITYINNNPYILLKVSKTNIIDYNFINKYNIFLNKKNIPNWDILWTAKIDNLEKNIDNVKDNIIKKTSNYYIGMTENAILIYKTLNLTNNYYLCHLRLDNDDSFYDPLNIIADHKMRDYAEYFKKEFYHNNKYHYHEINKTIINSNYNDTMLFFVRMLFPASFFDAYDKYIQNEKIDYSFYERIHEYETFLKYIYKQIKKKYNVIDIDWLK